MTGKEYRRNRARTKEGMISIAYSNQKLKCRRTGRDMPTYSFTELKEWALSQEVFHALFDGWVKSGYDKWSKPSFDRIDDYKSYSLDNIRITTWRINQDRYYEDVKNGLNNKRCKAIKCLSLQSGIETEYYSARDAERNTGVSYKYISSSSKKNNGSTYSGYIWSFA